MGFKIIVNKVIFVFSGNVFIKIVIGLRDYIVEYYVLVDKWGKFFVMVFILGWIIGDYFWFVVSDYNIMVFVVGLNNG